MVEFGANIKSKKHGLGGSRMSRAFVGATGRVALIACAALSAPSVSVAGQFTFVDVVNSSGVWDTFSTAPVINAHGMVASRGTFDGGGQGVVVADASGSRIAADSRVIGAPAGTSFNSFNNRPSINDAGAVAFIGSLDNFGGSGVFVSDTLGEITRMTSLAASGPLLDNSGAVVYFAGGGSARTMYRTAGGVTTQLFSASQLGLISFDGAEQNGTQLAFRGEFSGGQGLYRYDYATGVLTTIASSSSGFSSFQQLLSINSNGEVGFTTTSVYTAGGASPTIAVSGSQFSGLSAPALNDSGLMAFVGTPTIGPPSARVPGIYTTADLSDPVIRFGDPLFGSTLTQLTFDPSGMNESGQIAFRYQLANGIRGIAVATPTAVPDSLSTLATLLTTLSALIVARHRRR